MYTEGGRPSDGDKKGRQLTRFTVPHPSSSRRSLKGQGKIRKIVRARAYVRARACARVNDLWISFFAKKSFSNRLKLTNQLTSQRRPRFHAAVPLLFYSILKANNIHVETCHMPNAGGVTDYGSTEVRKYSREHLLFMVGSTP